MTPIHCPSNIYYALLPSSMIGSTAILWSKDKRKPWIDRVILSRPGMPAEQLLKIHYPESIELSCPEIEHILNQIRDYLQGKPVVFHLDRIRLNRCSAFQQSVLRAESEIPYGCVSTYQRLARHVKKSAAARAVGNALANNPFPIFIPCHRTVRSDLTPGGFQGGSIMKRSLLQMEGNTLDSHNRIINPKLFSF
ncbi:methylated-DNA--[protein]-cysteine S-methyltransferase [bacterium]|nr:methylated-DNA--[protein]-cysteine S-methyltransferase [bacterium]